MHLRGTVQLLSFQAVQDRTRRRARGHGAGRHACVNACSGLLSIPLARARCEASRATSDTSACDESRRPGSSLCGSGCHHERPGRLSLCGRCATQPAVSAASVWSTAQLFIWAHTTRPDCANMLSRRVSPLRRASATCRHTAHQVPT